jgi:hypothetical protein
MGIGPLMDLPLTSFSLSIIFLASGLRPDHNGEEALQPRQRARRQDDDRTV